MKIFVAHTADQARHAAIAAGRPDAKVIGTERPRDTVGLMPLAEDITWVDGWWRGRYAGDVEHELHRALAKRSVPPQHPAGSVAALERLAAALLELDPDDYTDSVVYERDRRAQRERLIAALAEARVVVSIRRA